MTNVGKNYYIVFISIIIFILDRLIKIWSVGKNINLFKYFSITYTRNYGAGFGIFQNQTLLIIFISIFVLGYIAYVLKEIPHIKYIWVAVGLVVGGTLGNLYDRIIFGYVIDYLNFKIWPVFNLADSALVIGASLLIYYFYKEKK